MTRIELNIKGQVQGVGFRPFVYKLANLLKLSGFIKNNSYGVEIQIEGKKEDIEKFGNLLVSQLPPLAKIDSIQTKKLTPLYKGQFEIIHSSIKHNDIGKLASVPPDIAICKECLLDLFSLNNPNNYFKYFATNCTNCGPRYSIIQTVPYDRVNTSMRDFSLCKSCKTNYENPSNRRYHAQPISCNDCGPTLSLITKCKTLNTDDIYLKISSLIEQGKIGAIKGVGGFHIVCDATNTDIIEKLRDYKKRETKPFAIMCRDIHMVEKYANISQKEHELLISKEAPIVIVGKNKNKELSSLVAPNINRIGIMLCYTGFHHMLFEYLKSPIIATSANLNGEPIIIDKKDIEQKLPFIDFIVDYNRDIVNAIDDSVVQVVNNDILTMRLARGYAPKEFKLPFTIDKKILAVGANQKNSICFAFDDKVIIAPYIGDLDSIKSLEFFYKNIQTFKNFYDFDPDIIIHDKHPNYETTKWAKQQNIKLFEVQHHLAHIYSVKAQYNLKGSYLGFAFDGTGYGDDDTLWGGEIFIGDDRKYSFKQIKLLGASKAVKEPKRVALSMLFEKYKPNEISEMNFEFINCFTKQEISLLYQSWQKDLNTPPSSSVGRYFDAVASMAELCQYQTYEGEAGLLCEMAYNKNIKEYFEYEIKDGIIDIKIVDFIVKYQNIKDKTVYSTMFINTLVQIIIDISSKYDLDVIFSGGVFQNKTLLELICSNLDRLHIKYYYNTTTSINDGGISLGQIWNYIHQSK